MKPKVVIYPLWKNTIGLAKKQLEIIGKPFKSNIVHYSFQ